MKDVRVDTGSMTGTCQCGGAHQLLSPLSAPAGVAEVARDQSAAPAQRVAGEEVAQHRTPEERQANVRAGALTTRKVCFIPSTKV